MRHVIFASIALLGLCAVPAANGADGNREEGRVKVYTCAGCHGVPGYQNAYPMYTVPKIHNQTYDYLVAALTAYRAGERSHPTMQAQGESMSDQDIADIALYLSGQPAAPAVAAEGN